MKRRPLLYECVWAKERERERLSGIQLYTEYTLTMALKPHTHFVWKVDFNFR